MGEDDGESPPAKVFGRGDFGVDDRGVSKAPCVDILAETLLQRYSVKALLQRYFGKGDASEVSKDGGDASHAEELGESDADVYTEDVSEVSFAKGRRSRVKMHLS